MPGDPVSKHWQCQNIGRVINKDRTPVKFQFEWNQSWLETVGGSERPKFHIGVCNPLLAELDENGSIFLWGIIWKVRTGLTFGFFILVNFLAEMGQNMTWYDYSTRDHLESFEAMFHPSLLFVVFQFWSTFWLKLVKLWLDNNTFGLKRAKIWLVVTIGRIWKHLSNAPWTKPNILIPMATIWFFLHIL